MSHRDARTTLRWCLRESLQETRDGLLSARPDATAQARCEVLTIPHSLASTFSSPARPAIFTGLFSLIDPYHCTPTFAPPVRYDFLMPRAKKASGGCLTPSDVILPMQDPYMTQITEGKKKYEFRKYCLKPNVERIWFYRTAPHSSITHVCETLPARTRNPGDLPLDEDGLGNAEFNNRHKDWDGNDSAYELVTVYELRRPIPLKEMKDKHGFKSAPRGLGYLPKSIS
ncbi:hypothetical protein VTO42DRAFT_1827 [Malbranchea cinnamomea]